MAVGRCKLTGKKGTFARAHVIPRAFYRVDGTTKRLPSNLSQRPSRAPIGLYDERLVVRATERRFAVLDDYGIRFMRGEIGTRYPLREGSNLIAYAVSGFDYTALKLFFLSILWRASASKRPELASCNLGDDEERLRLMVANENPGSADDFAILMLRFPDADGLTPITTPFRCREERGGMEFYRGHFADARVMWKVDRRELKSPLREMTLAPDRPWIVSAQSWYACADRKEFQELVRRSDVAYGAAWEIT